MFTALVVTRLAFETMMDKGWIEEFRMFSLVRKPSIEFSRIRRPAYLISAVVVVAGMVAFGMRGSTLYDIDFTGGSLVYVSLAEPTPVAEVRSRLGESGFPDAEVQAFRTPGRTEGGATDFGVRFKGAGVARVREKVKPEIERGLRKAGLLGPNDRVEVSADGRAVELKLQNGAREEDLRSALADGDPYELDEIGTIVPTEAEASFRQVTVRLHNIPALAEQREVWSRAITALSWAGLETRDAAIQKCGPPEQGDGLELVLDNPIARDLLSAEMVRRGFPDLRVAEGRAEDTRFVLRGDSEALARFRREFPAGAQLRGVPAVHIDDYTITAELVKEFSEPDIRVLFEKQDLPDVYVVPLDLAARSWRLNLSYEPIRERLRTAFADLAQRSGGVTFTEVSREGDQRIVEMRLAEPMAFADVRHHIRASGLGPYAEGIIVDEEDYGLETEVSELRLALPEGKADEIAARIGDSFGEAQVVQKIVSIGAVVAEELQGRALLAVIFASVIIVLYVAARFHALRFGVAAVIALVHDVLITAGLIALADWSGVLGDVKINLAMLAAFLTILGYSLNDTIVVFDRIRENMGILGRDRVSPDLVNMSINQTLSRTVLTSMTTLMVVVVLYALGGPVLRGLALTLIFGVIVGTYSSMFIASPVLLDWSHLARAVSAFFRSLFFLIRLPFRFIGMAFGGSR
jgi:preprotein translocase SecF subunit